MKSSRLPRLLAVFAPALALVLPAAPSGAAEADRVIAQARAALAPEPVLEAVRSIRFVGTILLQDGNSGDIEIIVRKPMQQRVTITLGNARETTALSDYDGWRRVENLAQPSEWELTLLEPPQIRRLRANTVENIGFFRGVDAVGGEIRHEGEAEVGGVPCHKISFVHARGIVFTRYFNRETGRLVRTEMDDGSRLTEAGELVAGGIRFPREIETVTPQGRSTVLFSRVEVDAAFDDAVFDVPMLLPGGRR